MRKVVACAALVFSCLILVDSAAADSIPFSMSGSNPTSWSTSGVFAAAPAGAGVWTVTGATGTFNGVSITGVWPTSNSGNTFLFNNKYYWPGPVFDIYGVVITLADGDLVNFCYDTGCGGASATYTAIQWDPSSGYTFYNASTSSFSIPVPEASTLTLIGSGLLGLVGRMRRRVA